MRKRRYAKYIRNYRLRCEKYTFLKCKLPVYYIRISYNKYNSHIIYYIYIISISLSLSIYIYIHIYMVARGHGRDKYSIPPTDAMRTRSPGIGVRSTSGSGSFSELCVDVKRGSAHASCSGSPNCFRNYLATLRWRALARHCNVAE